MRTAGLGEEGRVGLRAVVLFGASTLVVGAIGSAKIWAAHTSTAPLAFQRSLPLIVVGELLAYFAVMLWQRRVPVPLRLVLSGVALGVALRFGQACLASVVGPPPESDGFSSAFTHYYATFYPAVLMQIGVTVLYLWLVRGAFEPQRKPRSARRPGRTQQVRPRAGGAPVLVPQAPPAEDGTRERRLQLIEALRRQEAEQQAEMLQGEQEQAEDDHEGLPGPADGAITALEGEPTPPEPEPVSEPVSQAVSEPVSEPVPPAEAAEVDERLRRQLEEARAHASAESVLRALHAADDEVPQEEDDLPFVTAAVRPVPAPASPVAGPPAPAASREPAPEATDAEDGEPPLAATDEASGDLAQESPDNAALGDEQEAGFPGGFDPGPEPRDDEPTGLDLLAEAFARSAGAVGLPHCLTVRVPGDRTVSLASTVPVEAACSLAGIEGLLGSGSEICRLSVAGDLSRVLLRCSSGCVGLAPVLRGRRGLCLVASITGRANLGAADVALAELEAAALQLELPHWPVYGPVDAPPAYPDHDLSGRIAPLLEWVPEVAGLQPMAASAGGAQVVLLCHDAEGSSALSAAVAHGLRAADELCGPLGHQSCGSALWISEEGTVAGGRVELSGQHVIVALWRTGPSAASAASIQLNQILNALSRLSPAGL